MNFFDNVGQLLHPCPLQLIILSYPIISYIGSSTVNKNRNAFSGLAVLPFLPYISAYYNMAVRAQLQIILFMPFSKSMVINLIPIYTRLISLLKITWVFYIFLCSSCVNAISEFLRPLWAQIIILSLYIRSWKYCRISKMVRTILQFSSPILGCFCIFILLCFNLKNI